MTSGASPIFLLDTATDDAVEAELLCEVADCHINDWHRLWQPEIGRIRYDLAGRGVPRAQWPQSAHWNWARKIDEVDGILGFNSFCVTVGGVTQGLMRMDLNQLARIERQRGLPLVYVDYVEAAPWNTPYAGSPVRYKGVGSLLMAAAIEHSLEEGFKGRVGLHSLPQSERFYQRLEMTDLGRDANCQELRYFELTPEQAAACLKEE